MPGSVGALIGALGGRPVEHKPSRNIFGDFRCELILTNPSATVLPHQLIEGILRINTSEEIHHYGIRVQFEAFIDVKYETKVDNRIEGRHRKMGNLVAGASEPKEGYYIYSPINHQIVGSAEENDDEACRDTMFTITPGSHTYPFQIQYTGENLPAPFRNQYGTLFYKIASYMRDWKCYVLLGEKPLKFRGVSNLADREESDEFIRNECWLYKSIFSSKKAVTMIFEVTNSLGGFLPGEEIHFCAKITNPKSYMVKHFSVVLHKRTIYHIEGALNPKSTLASVGNFETSEISNAKEIIWNGKILIPRNCSTSYCSKKIYQVIYQLEYRVKVQEYSRDLKGQLKVWIGTTRDTSREITSSMSNSNVYEMSGSGMHRTLSTMSSLSDSSVRTGLPDYSQLSSRRSSMISIATLPPHYDDLV